VDRLLLENNAARSLIRKVHPEICFWAFNDREPMQCSKKRRCGKDERIRVLESVPPKTRELLDAT
jgi:predicted RNase H-like nuclease